MHAAHIANASSAARFAMSGQAVVRRRTWPSREAAGTRVEAGYDAALAWNGWLDSTLDLRDGLSVVEVFAPIDQPAALNELALLRQC